MYGIKKVLLVAVLAILHTGCEAPGSTSKLERASGIEGDEAAECAFTQGYWKNHPEAWPVESLALGNHVYSRAELLDLLHRAIRGNGCISLEHQLIAAKLNLANGAAAGAIADDIAAADALIGDLVCPTKGTGYLSPSSTSAVTSALDHFNNTGECAEGDEPSCGNGVVEPGEQCDDGNQNDHDGCRYDCTLCPPACGNGVLEPGEECDDGNQVDNDECSNHCKICIPVVG